LTPNKLLNFQGFIEETSPLLPLLDEKELQENTESKTCKAIAQPPLVPSFRRMTDEVDCM